MRAALAKTLLPCLLFTAAAMTGCDKLRPPGPPPAKSDQPPEVFYLTPTTAEVTDYEDFTGRTVAIPTIDIRARVTGYLDKINFRGHEGGEVREGDVLFEIDPRPYQAEVLRANASLQQAQAVAGRHELDYQRAKKLIEGRTISAEQYDLVRGERAEAMATVEMMRANLALARLNLDYCQVKAPITGRVSRTQLDVGNLVKADETILTTIVSMDPMYIYFEIDERTTLRIRRYIEMGRIKTADERVPVWIGLHDEEGFPRKGVVNFFDNRLDTSTGTLQVRGEFANSDGVLTPGLFARVRLPVGEPYRALLIAEEALGTDQGQKFVYVIDQENNAQYRRVQVGKLQKGQRVVLEGLSEGERVVTSGLQRVRPGAPVQPRAEEATADSRPAAPEMAGVPAAHRAPSPK